MRVRTQESRSCLPFVCHSGLFRLWLVVPIPIPLAVHCDWIHQAFTDSCAYLCLPGMQQQTWHPDVGVANERNWQEHWTCAPDQTPINFLLRHPHLHDLGSHLVGCGHHSNWTDQQREQFEARWELGLPAEILTRRRLTANLLYLYYYQIKCIKLSLLFIRHSFKSLARNIEM